MGPGGAGLGAKNSTKKANFLMLAYQHVPIFAPFHKTRYKVLKNVSTNASTKEAAGPPLFFKKCHI